MSRGNRRNRSRGVVRAAVLLLLCAGCGTTYRPATDPPPNFSTYFSANYTLVTMNHGSSFYSESQAPIAPDAPADYMDAGSYTATSQGFLDIAITEGILQNVNAQGNWALEIPGVMGLLSLNYKAEPGGIPNPPNGGSYLIPMVSNAACPSASSAQTWQYISLQPVAGGTAYGTAQISVAKGLVNFTNIQHYLFPSAANPAGTPVPDSSDPGPSAISGYCGDGSAYGPMVSVTQSIASLTSTDALNFASGFLFENNIANTAAGNPQAFPVLGASGSLGLAQPSSALDVSSYAGATYNAFSSNGSPASFSGSSSACSALQARLQLLATPPSANTVYGGTFPNADPSSSQTPSCNMAIDLGTQDPKNNGLFTSARVFIATGNSGSGTKGLITAHAVAIAGSIQAQNAIFVETNYSPGGTSLSFYLLQASQ